LNPSLQGVKSKVCAITTRVDKQKTIIRKEGKFGAKGIIPGALLKMPTVRTTGKNN
jgi:hypothetical protein